MARAGAAGRARKLAFSYALESDPGVAAEFLAKLTLQQKHSQIPMYESKVELKPNSTPLKSAKDAFSCMPKKSADHRDGWT